MHDDLVMYRLVLDTNILISSLWGGKPRELIDLWLNGTVRVLSTPAIIEEYLAVLSRFELSLADMQKWARLFTERTERIEEKTIVDIIKSDPADNKFLSCAVSGDANYVVSGDKHLLKLKKYNNIVMIKTSDFLDIYYRSIGWDR
ncbi:MAG: putative toxin-antitoxin system toxin component, PIN family [Candidatus Margulisiibacteriota bacterium]